MSVSVKILCLVFSYIWSIEGTLHNESSVTIYIKYGRFIIDNATLSLYTVIYKDCNFQSTDIDMSAIKK